MAMTPITTTTPTEQLASALLAGNSGIQIVAGSATLKASALEAVNWYDGTLNLGIGAGLLLTSGWTPGTMNDSTGDGQDNSPTSGFDNGDADINAVVNTVFQTQSYDATALEFDFTVADPNATSISFDLVFGSEEYPEWVDAFVDSAVVMVNGVNYALFNHDPNAPLSVISSNLAAGYFQDNADGHLQIQYDGVSQVLKIVAPINAGSVNHIKIGIADTGDHILDSGIFIANLTAGNIPGSGVVSSGGTGTSGDDHMTGSAKSEFFDAGAGNDAVYGAGGDDIVLAGAGKDAIYGGSGNDELEGDGGDDHLDGGADTDTAVYTGNAADYSLSYDATSGTTTVMSQQEGADRLVNVERIQFKDGLFGLQQGILTAIQPNTTSTNVGGTAAISGVAMQDKTLSAMVIDPNGFDTAGVHYEWLISTDGTQWSVAGQESTFVPTAAGVQVKVHASYTDHLGFQESVTSSVVTIAQTSTQITVQPMQLAAPVGAGVMNPLTTLVLQATTLGYSPTEASLLVKNALGIAPDLNLATYDFFSALTNGDTSDDGPAMAFGKVAGMVAMTASVSDPSGMNLTLAVLTAGAQGQVIDLTNANDLAAAGLDAAAIAFVEGLNLDMADATSFDKMKNVWDDWAGQKDNLKPLKGHFETLSVDLNLAPTGYATTQFETNAGETLTLSNNELIAGFIDPDGDVLTAMNLHADQGGVFVQAADGTWLFTPEAEFSGPVEVSYGVSDGQNTSTATTLLVVHPVALPPGNHSPTGEVWITGDAAEDSVLTASHTLADADGMGPVSYQWYADGAAIAGATHTTYALTATDVGTTLTVEASYTDGAGTFEVVSSAATTAVIHVDHAATGDLLMTGTAQEGGTIGVNSSAVSDVDGALSFTYQWQINTGTANTPVWVDLPNQTQNTFSIPGTQELVGQQVRVMAISTDTWGGQTVMASAPCTVLNVNDAPTGGVILSGTAQQGQTLNATHTLADEDGLGTITYQWLANGQPIAGATGSSYTLTAGEVGQTISVKASYVDGYGTAESVYSSATNTVTAPPPPPGVTLTGTSKADVLTGTAGNDTLNGLGGNDTLYGGDGDDVVNGGAGTDKMDGGKGSDVYLIANASEHSAAEITDSGSSGVDVLRFTATKASTLTLYAGDTGLEQVILGTGTVALSVNGAAVKNGLLLTGNAGLNTLTGTAFADTLDGGAGSDKLVGGSGNDTYIVDITSTGTLQDTITESGSDNADALVLRGTSSNSTAAAINLTTGLENLDASATGNSLLNLNGNTANNTLTGNAANNVISGGAGNDWLFGGLGADTLDGGTGNDVFAYSATVQSDRALTDVVKNVDFGGVGPGNAVDRFHFDGLTLTQATLLNNVSTNAMNTLAALQNTLSFMTAGEAVLLNVTSGVGVGTYLFVDANGTQGYQASGDYAIQLLGVSNLNNFDLSDLLA